MKYSRRTNPARPPGMTLPSGLSDRDRAEVERSAAEADRVGITPVEVERYFDPSADTSYGLECAFYLLGDIRGQKILDLGCGTGENLIPWSSAEPASWWRWIFPLIWWIGHGAGCRARESTRLARTCKWHRLTILACRLTLSTSCSRSRCCTILSGSSGLVDFNSFRRRAAIRVPARREPRRSPFPWARPARTTVPPRPHPDESPPRRSRRLAAGKLRTGRAGAIARLRGP